jgi:hypothetical protein
MLLYIFFAVCFLAFCLLLLAALGYLMFLAIGEDSAAEYRTSCVENGGGPLYNGKYWECVK